MGIEQMITPLDALRVMGSDAAFLTFSRSTTVSAHHGDTSPYISFRFMRSAEDRVGEQVDVLERHPLRHLRQGVVGGLAENRSLSRCGRDHRDRRDIRVRRQGPEPSQVQSGLESIGHHPQRFSSA